MRLLTIRDVMARLQVGRTLAYRHLRQMPTVRLGGAVKGV